MTLNYDFDIFELFPKDENSDIETSKFLRRLGLMARKPPDAKGPGDIGQSRVALFRDVQTADALRSAPDGLRDYFLAAGFGLNTYSSGAPRHSYPAADEDARLEIIERLTELAPSFALPEPGDYHEGGMVFRLGAFLSDLAAARPQVTGSISYPDLAPAPVIQRRKLAPTFDTCAPEVVISQRKFWQSRYFMAALAVGLAAAALQLTHSFDALNIASL